MHPAVRLLAALQGFLSVCSLASTTANAQSGAPFAVVREPVKVDSGFLSLDAEEPAVVFATELVHAGANSLRLIFADSSLPGGSKLRLIGARDGAVQVFDARSLFDWGEASAVFNGDTIRVELVAGPHTRGNRVVVKELEVGLAVPQVGIDDLCGADDRTASQDPRAGRQYPYGCTVWLANEFTVVTAGHCTRDPNQQVHFNVPPSDSNGVPRFPAPEDQYPFEVPSVQRLDAGVGADWTVARVVANSNTGLYPGQAQGSWYETGAVPQIAGGNVRVTGFGVVSDPARLTASQTEQTDVAPLLALSTDSVTYGCDTTGGSSGSPVIEIASGRVIGVHTHGNCAFAGNLGTRIDRADLQQALSQTKASKVLGKVRRFGQGCPTSSGTPDLDFTGYPTVGGVTAVRLGPIPPGGSGALLVGASDQSWAGNSLPAPVPVVPGCTLYVSIEFSASGAIVGNVEHWTWQLPSDPALVGGEFGLQGVAFEPNAAGALDLGLSDALWMTVGRDH